MKQKTWYAIHRWMTLVLGLQLLAWSLGGLIFSTHDIDWVRGMDGHREDAPAGLDLTQALLSPAEAASRSKIDRVKRVVLKRVASHTVYAVHGDGRTVLVDAKNGETVSPIDEKTARAVARADREADVNVAESSMVTENPETEYRKKPLPAWRIDLSDSDNTHIYVDASTGEITARRNDAWRRFDFFWMLHTMDYFGRDDFNTPWLIIFAAFGVLTVLSGWAVWIVRFLKARRRRVADA